MAGITGRQVDIAFAKFAVNSWGVAASVTKGMYFSSDGGLKLAPTIIDDDAFGQVFVEQAEVGDVQAPAPTFGGISRYDDYSYIWDALAMGSPTAATISTSAAGQVTSWLHTFDLADVIDGLGVTLAIDKVQYVEELTSAKVYGWDEAPGAGGMMQRTYKVIGSKTTNISSVNINSTIGGATFPALGNRIFRKQGVFRMNKHTAGALAAGDAVKAETVKFAWERPQDSPHVFGQDYVDEPADNGFPTFSLDVGYPRMNTIAANSLYAGLRDGTAWKADWTFNGAFINSTDQYKKLYQWPYLQLEAFEAPVVGANQIKPKATFKARMAPTSPAGMAFIRPFRLTRIQLNSPVAF
jgi:hypothetical protein